jgi:cytosine/creatinine deaminase
LAAYRGAGGVSRGARWAKIDSPGAEEWTCGHGIDAVVVDDARCVALMQRLQKEKPDLWGEDISE